MVHYLIIIAVVHYLISAVFWQNTCPPANEGGDASPLHIQWLEVSFLDNCMVRVGMSMCVFHRSLRQQPAIWHTMHLQTSKHNFQGNAIPKTGLRFIVPYLERADMCNQVRDLTLIGDWEHANGTSQNST